MCHTFKHVIHVQYFLMLPNLVIVFVHWVSTGVLYEPRQCSLFWDYIPESKLCCWVNVCRPPDPYSIRPIQKLFSCQITTRGVCCSKNSAVTWYLYQMSARTNEGKTSLSYSRTVSWMVSSCSASCSWRPLDWRIRHSHLTSTLFHSLVPWWRPRRIRPQRTRLG